MCRVTSAVPTLSMKSITTTKQDNCCGTSLGHTYARCSFDRRCASPLFCLNLHSHTTCGYTLEEECHCEPIVMTPCLQATDCLSYPSEICAFLPHSQTYCYSEEFVSSNSSVNVYQGDCCGDTPPSSKPRPSSKPQPLHPSTSSSFIPEHPATSSLAHPSPSSPPFIEPTKPADSTPHPAPSDKEPPKIIPKPSFVGESPAPEKSPGDNGLAGEPCSSSKPCKDYRECAESPCDTSTCPSQCTWSMLCDCTSDCYSGEICVSYTDSESTEQNNRYCYSPFRVQNLPNITIHSCDESGMTGDGCIDDSICKGGRKCVQGGRSECLGGLRQCGLDRPACGKDGISAFDCFCSGVSFCDCTNPCTDDGEVCCDTTWSNSSVCLSREGTKDISITKVKCGYTFEDEFYEPASGQMQYAVGNPLQLAPVSIPNEQQQAAFTASPTPNSSSGSGTGSNSDVVAASTVCVDAKALEEAGVDLVYKDHQRGSVLCDQNGSCATPGHLVSWNGRPMMMKRYCADIVNVLCNRRVMWVNSIRFRRKVVVSSKTIGLEYTALAARYESSMEELMLRAVVRLGF